MDPKIQSEQLKGLPNGTLVDVYARLRNVRDARKAELDIEIKPLKEAIELIENTLLGRLLDQNMQNFTSSKDTATVYKRTETSVTVSEWDAVFSYMQEKNSWEFLDHRVNKTAVLEHLDKYGCLPPGVAMSQFVRLGFRSK